MEAMPSSGQTAASNARRRKLFIALGCVLIPAVLCLSFLPGTDKYVLHTRGRFHSLGHLITFSALAYVAMRSARTLQVRTLLFVTALFLGFAIELGEHLVYRSYMEWKDVLLDSLGVITGTILALITEPTAPYSPNASTPARSPFGH